jgi:hypothetical protein
MSRFAIFKEFWGFVRARKRYWLLGILLVLAETSALAPFIYTIF